MRNRRFICTPIPGIGKKTELDPSESNHAIRVLRIRNEETVVALDGEGRAQSAKALIRGNSVFLEGTDDFQETRTREEEVVPLHLEISVVKPDSMHVLIEKAVELGVEEITPLIAERSVTQIQKKGPEHYQEKWQRIADQSLKQCERLHRMRVHLPKTDWLENSSSERNRSHWIPLEQGLRKGASLETPQTRLLQEKNTAAWSIRIGPEGGWTEREKEISLDHGYKPIDLGPLVLRTETASLYCASILAEHWRGRTQELTK